MADSAGKARAEGTEVTLRSKTMVLDFEGEYRVGRAGDSVRPAELRLVADLPDLGGQEDGGTVVLEQAGGSLGASVAQPGGDVRLVASGDVRWTSPADGELAADGEIGFVLAEAPESTVLVVRELRITSA
ncbi:hypothetical protein [Lentzea sp.]|uniref:hypothetical protein n=1 Tax=Lentzea sp. TaxID=56099 RepID=UPI002ED3A1E5